MKMFIKNCLFYSLLAAAVVVTGWFTFVTAGTYIVSQSYIEKVYNTKGKVIGFDGKLLAIEFDKELIKPRGDTRINSFLVNSDGTSIQLKPIIIPEKKAVGVSDSKDIVFPISDILSLLEPRVYAIEIYVSNSKYSPSSIQLPLIALDLTGEEK